MKDVQPHTVESTVTLRIRTEVDARTGEEAEGEFEDEIMVELLDSMRQRFDHVFIEADVESVVAYPTGI